jgi:hypothetical protein
VGGGGGTNAADSNSALYDWSTVGGGRGNLAGNSATVGGGVSNTAIGTAASVGGGSTNYASSYSATVGGGNSNIAEDIYTTVSGGYSNIAAGYAATAAGGSGNVAVGQYSTVPGGYSNRAGGEFSFAAGTQAKANHTGTFVWADSESADFASTGVNQFLIRASGGVGIGTNYPGAALDVETVYGTGIYGYSANGWGVWGRSLVSFAGEFWGDLGYTGTLWGPSDAKLKENIQPATGLLSKVLALEPHTYNFKHGGEYKELNLAKGRHYGLIAQELEKVFPELVRDIAQPSTDHTKQPIQYKNVNYIELIPILVQAIKEQQGMIDQLRTDMDKLKGNR